MIDCLVRCYQGDHSLCRRTSFVCQLKRPWYKRSPYLRKGFVLKLEGDDLNTFRKLIGYRLGISTLRLMETLQSTQKSEAVNRGLSASNSKNVTFSRNYAARMHSAAARINRGPGNAMYDQMMAIGCRVAPGTRVARGLLKMNRRTDLKRKYFKSLEYKVRRCRRRQKLFRKHRENKDKVSYRPGMVYEMEDTKCTLEHSYATRRRYRPLK